MRLIVSRAAAADVQRLHAFLAEAGPAVAQRAATLLDAAIQSLHVFPSRGRPSGIPGIRELIVPFGGSSYVLRYAYFPGSDSLVILRVWHGRENRT